MLSKKLILLNNTIYTLLQVWTLQVRGFRTHQTKSDLIPLTVSLWMPCTLIPSNLKLWDWAFLNSQDISTFGPTMGFNNPAVIRLDIKQNTWIYIFSLINSVFENINFRILLIIFFWIQFYFFMINNYFITTNEVKFK